MYYIIEKIKSYRDNKFSPLKIDTEIFNTKCFTSYEDVKIILENIKKDPNKLLTENELKIHGSINIQNVSDNMVSFTNIGNRIEYPDMTITLKVVKLN